MPTLTDQNPDDEIRVDLEMQALALVRKARDQGFVLTITTHPLKPLAMGNYTQVVELAPVFKRE